MLAFFGPLRCSNSLAMKFHEVQTTDFGSIMLEMQGDPKQLTDFIRSFIENPRRLRRLRFWLAPGSGEK
jgi:hypothetical protein